MSDNGVNYLSIKDVARWAISEGWYGLDDLNDQISEGHKEQYYTHPAGLWMHGYFDRRLPTEAQKRDPWWQVKIGDYTAYDISKVMDWYTKLGHANRSSRVSGVPSVDLYRIQWGEYQTEAEITESAFLWRPLETARPDLDPIPEVDEVVSKIFKKISQMNDELYTLKGLVYDLMEAQELEDIPVPDEFMDEVPF